MLLRNDLSQNWHLSGFCPMWIAVCLLRLWLNAFWHILQLYSFFMIWILAYLMRLPREANDFQHIRHLYGFSLVWVLIYSEWFFTKLAYHQYGFSYLFSDDFNQQRFPDTTSTCELSPCYGDSCSFSDYYKKQNDFRHILHLYGFSPVWVLICTFILAGWINDLSPTLQVYGFSKVYVL